MPEFLFVYRAWSNPVFPETLYITGVECHDFFGWHAALEVNNTDQNILRFFVLL